MPHKIVDKKFVKVSSLPDSCSHKATLGSMVSDMSQAEVAVVLVQRDGTHQVYVGYPDLSSVRKELQGSSNMRYVTSKIRSVQAVASLGVKMESEAAAQLFPDTIGRR